MNSEPSHPHSQYQSDFFWGGGRRDSNLSGRGVCTAPMASPPKLGPTSDGFQSRVTVYNGDGEDQGAGRVGASIDQYGFY